MDGGKNLIFSLIQRHRPQAMPFDMSHAHTWSENALFAHTVNSCVQVAHIFCAALFMSRHWSIK